MARNNRSESTKLQVTVDAETERLIGEIATLGLHGTSKAEVACTILRSWLWENQAKLQAVGVEIGRNAPSSK